MTSHEADLMLDQTAEAVRGAAESVQTTSKSIAGAIKADRRSSSPLYRLAEMTRAAPLRSLIIAFAVGYFVSR